MLFGGNRKGGGMSKDLEGFFSDGFSIGGYLNFFNFRRLVGIWEEF